MTPEEQATKFRKWIEQTITEIREWQDRIQNDLSLLEDSLVVLRQVGMDLPNASKIIRTTVHIGHNRKILNELFDSLKEV